MNSKTNVRNEKSDFYKIIMNEKTFYIYVVSCMIIIPASELISEIFDLGFIQSFILTIYGIIGGLLSFAKLYYNIKQSGIKWQDIFFISLFGFSFIALIFSKDIENSITGLDYDELPTHFLAYYSLMYSAFQLEKTKHRRSVIYIFAGLSFFEGIIGIFQSFEIKIQDVMFDISDHQVYGLTQNTNFFGGLSVIFVGITLALLVFSKKKLTLIVNSIGFAIAIYCSFNTMARLAWVGDLAVFTFMIISIVIMKIKKSKKTGDSQVITDGKSRVEKNIFSLYLRRYILAVLITIVIVVLSFIKSDIPLSKINQSIEEVNGEAEAGFGSGRGYIWSYCLESVPKHWITGIGLDNLKMCFTENQTWHEGMHYQDKAHNEYLHTLSTQGVLALLNYLALLGFSLRMAVSRIVNTSNEDERIIAWTFLAAFSGYIVQAFFNSSIINVAMYFWVVIGMLNPRARKIIISTTSKANRELFE